MSQNPLVTFTICTYNRADYLDDTLNSLHHQNLAEQFELLIVDNNSDDHTADVFKKYQQQLGENADILRYVREPKQGLSHARNRGIQEAKGNYIVFLDDDIRACRSLIPSWIAFFSDNPDAVAAGGKIHVQFDSARPNWMSHFLLPLLGYHDLGSSLKTYPKQKYPFGGNMGFKKSIFDEIKDFDTELGRKGKSLNAGEEKELFRRIRSTDHNIYYLPDAFLYHRVDEGRLTKEYIKNQALGLGKSMQLRLQNRGLLHKLMNWISEAAKFLVSFPLAIGYLFILQPQKAAMLFKFRRWIWKGYFENKN